MKLNFKPQDIATTMKMKPSISRILTLLLFGLCAGVFNLAAATSNPPDLMTYQGYLVDVNGAPLAPSAPANYSIVFRIYDASTGGNILWSEQQIVTVDKGNFSVVLGEGTEVSGEARPALSVAFLGANASDRFLGITVTISETTMTISPRLRLLPSPYAFTAAKAMSIEAQSSSRLSDNPLYLSTGSDLNNGLGYFSTFASAPIGGPALFGASGGVLGTVGNGTDQSAALFWNSSGNVGIGTLSPSTMLQIGEGVNKGPGGLKINTGWVNPSAPSENPPLDVQVRGESKLVVNTDGNVAMSAKLDVAGSVKSSAHVSTSGVTTHEQGAWLEWNKDNGSGATYLLNQKGFGPGGIIIGQVSTANEILEHMRIDSKGYVGMRNNAPDAPLTVSHTGAESFGVALHLQAANNFDGARLEFERVGVKGWGIGIGEGVGNPTFGIFEDNHTTLGWGAPRLSITSGGRVGIGTTTPGAKLEVSGDIWVRNYDNPGDDRIASFWRNTRGVNISVVNSLNNSGTRHAIYDGDANWDFDSDQRLKKDIVDAEPMLEQAMKVQVRRFRWKDSPADSKLMLGVIAQELQPIFPHMVVERADPKTKETTLTVGYGDFAVIAIKALQEFKQRHDTEIRSLRQHVESIKEAAERIGELEQKAAKVETLEHEVAELRKVVAELASVTRKSSTPVAALSVDGKALTVANH
jgi:hypothetical protein